ncbi:MAG: 6-phosphofructokinase [Elusimicrobia bacterium]|nr:6-phosphofructokinase [Elusimicrobiota bacterium]
MKRRLGIVVGGGPAPGINGVISSATIAAVNSGFEVIGIYDGFKWLSRGDTRHVRHLTIADVSRIHFTGGSILSTSRENPMDVPEGMQRIVQAVKKLGITHLMTIGGEGTASLAARLGQVAGRALRLVHVPKTIDNDIPLPGATSTFGFQTARHVGTYLVQNLMEDARTTNRWYLVVTMGRRSGFLASGICFASGATLAVIPEEFSGKVTLARVVDVLEAAVIKRKWLGRSDGVAILAEGLAMRIAKDRADLQNTQPDEFGHLKLPELDFGRAVKEELERRLARAGQKITLIAKDIGYELRSCNPIPFDVDYTRRLGYGAVGRLISGEDRVIICFKGGAMAPVRFADILDRKTGRVRVRHVDIHSEYYQAATSYMIRLKHEDLRNPETLAGLAKTAGLSPREFLTRFQKIAVD